jgi:hypothetical protein
MRSLFALAALVVALLLAACTNTRTAPDAQGRTKGTAPQFDASTLAGAVGGTAGTRGAMGGSFTGELSAEDATMNEGQHYLDAYGVAGKPGDRAVIALRSTGFDPYLIVYNPETGDILAENDDWENDRTHSRIEFDFPSEATFGIAVSSYYSLATGPYELTVESPGPVWPIDLSDK